ncbi:unnamed protein product [Rotaria sp. Silwood1]|nr:unnamed protein product [Rotaria sp. Silwood1]
MSMTALLFAFAMIDNLLLLFINIYNIITLSDLEIDIINVRQACNKLNQTFLPEVVLHIILTVFFIFNNNWFIFILNIVLDLWFAYKYFKRQPGQLGFYDPLEINNRRNIKAHMKDFLIRLIFYLLCFLLYLFFFDIGPILMQQSFPLSTNITMFELLKMTANVGCSLLKIILENPIKARQNAQEQSSSGITYAHKLNKYAFYIDWYNHTIEDIDRLYRALNDIANLRTSFRQKPVRLKLLTLITDQTLIDNLNVISSQPGTAIYNKSLECICIRCKNGWIGFQKIAYRKSMYARDFQNGYISKIDRFVFDSIHNPLFDHIYDRRLPPS